MNALDLIALTFCPVGPGFWWASDHANGGNATNRALGAVYEWHGRSLAPARKEQS